MDNFVITIARGYGSGGKTIGQMLARELDIPFYDREIITLASEDSGINEALFGKADEKLKSSIFRPRTNVYKGGVIPPNSSDFVSEENLFNYQAKIIRQLADTESCVIVGKCADYVLGDKKNVVKLFVYADEKTCIKNVVDMYAISESDAKKRIDKIDKHRSDYYKYYTGSDWDKANNYDLCLNTGDMDFETCLEIVKGYLKIKLR